VDELGHEFWNAKDLAKLLGYRQYTNFTGAIRKAEIACKESGEAVSDHFLHVKEMIPGGKGAKRPYPPVHLSRFACYLLVENADPEGRPIVAMGQKYFAVHTRRQELADELTLLALPEDQKRLIYRREMVLRSLRCRSFLRSARHKKILFPLAESLLLSIARWRLLRRKAMDEMLTSDR